MKNFCHVVLLQIVFLLAINQIECMNVPFIVNRIRQGRCPRGDFRVGDKDSMDVCERFCLNDFDCFSDTQLCCPTECGDGYVCVEKDSQRFVGVKHGNCPRQIPIPKQNAKDYCQSDFSCEKAEKCCQTRKGKRCTAPLFTESLPPICPDFSGLDTTPCKIPGVSKCKNNRDCKGSSYQTCCRYECGGICIDS